MKKNYYKAMAAAIAMGLAATPSISFAAGNETVQAWMDNGEEDWDEEEDGFEEELNEDEEAPDEDWDGEEEASDEDWDGEEEASDEDWDGEEEISDEDWDEDDEDWDEEDDVDWADEGDENWDGEDDGLGIDNDDDAEDWEYDEAVEEPADPMYTADDAKVMEEAVPSDRMPCARQKDDADRNGAVENGEVSKPVKAAEDIVGKAPSRQAEYAEAKDSGLAGMYQAKAESKVFSGAGEGKTVFAEIGKDARVYCYGYYTERNGEKWLYVQYFQDGSACTGFCKDSQLKRAGNKF